MSVVIAVDPQTIEEDPSFPGFVAWVNNAMGVPEAVADDANLSPFLQLAYDTSINVAWIGLKLVRNRSPYRYSIKRPTPAPTPPIVEPPHPAHPIAPPSPAFRWQTLSIYAIAVYNLGGHVLCEIAQDDPNLAPPNNTFWADLRTKLGMNGGMGALGLVTSASDNGTSAGQQIPDQISGMSMMNLWMLSSPWGRMYLMLAGQWGNIWGIG